MSDPKAIIAWAEELVAFANGEREQPRTPRQMALLREVRRRLTLLGREKKPYRRALRAEAERWLKSETLLEPVYASFSFDKHVRELQTNLSFPNKAARRRSGRGDWGPYSPGS